MAVTRAEKATELQQLVAAFGEADDEIVEVDAFELVRLPAPC